MRPFHDPVATLHVATPATGIGAPVMAVGIFGAAALQRLPGGASFIVPLAALLVAAWVAAAATLLRSICVRGIARHTHPIVDSFAIGTWVAGTAVVARIMMLAAPALPGAAIALFALSVGLWLWFFPLAVRNFLRLVRTRQVRPSGVILLTTVATQAIALIALRLFPDLPSIRHLAAALSGVAAVCYVAGVAFVVVRLRTGQDWSIERDWDNTNCIIHGALSITGLTVVVGDFLPGYAVLWFWVCVAIVFLAVELIELARLTARVQELGWRRALLIYDPSQWARNFTFGMFYAFTLAFSQRFTIETRHSTLDALRDAVVDHGQYVVLLLLLIELGLLLHACSTGADKRWQRS
jgi:hypothetical protein